VQIFGHRREINVKTGMRETGISFNGVAIAARHHHTQLLQAFSRVLTHGVFLNGPENAYLENQLTRTLKNGYVTTVASGHDALTLSLLSLKAPPGSEIIVPANAYPTAFPVALSGYTIIPVDVDKNGQLDPEKAKQAITSKTCAIIMVHLYGLVGDILSVRRLCRIHKLIFIEDAAQAFGSTYNKQYVGTLGDIGCFSFYPTKNLGSLGDGGAIWVKNRSRYTYIKQAAMYGEKIRYKSMFASGHSRLPELQAAGLRVYLPSFPVEIKRRQQIASWYRNAWQTLHLDTYGYPLTSVHGSSPAPHLFVVSVAKRNALRTYLTAHHIPTYIHYPYPIHKVRAFSHLCRPNTSFTEAEYLAKTKLSLPFHPYMRKSDVMHITASIKQFYVSHHRS
jgi:dTDP-4-amino-4,6-dideoxygalactose transaminase